MCGNTTDEILTIFDSYRGLGTLFVGSDKGILGRAEYILNYESSPIPKSVSECDGTNCTKFDFWNVAVLGNCFIPNFDGSDYLVFGVSDREYSNPGRILLYKIPSSGRFPARLTEKDADITVTGESAGFGLGIGWYQDPDTGLNYLVVSDYLGVNSGQPESGFICLQNST